MGPTPSLLSWSLNRKHALSKASLLYSGLLVLAGCGTADETALPAHFNLPTDDASDATSLAFDGSAKDSAKSDAGGCVAKACAELGHPCGEIPDECGGRISCTVCLEGQTCGGGGFNVCGSSSCTPTTCESSKATCGALSDGCGHVIDCGSCASDQPCNKNQCSCTPTTCTLAGASCGSISDGCGHVLDCGTCTPGLTCNENQCSCTPTTCALAGANCGSISDGCGKVLECGTCTTVQVCTNTVCACSPVLVGPNPTHPVYQAFLTAYPAAKMPKTSASVESFAPVADGHTMTWAKINPGKEFIDDNNGGVITANILKGRDLARQHAKDSLPAGATILDTKEDASTIEVLPDPGNDCANHPGVGWGWGSLLFKTATQGLGEVVYLYIGFCSNGDTEAFFNSLTPAQLCEIK